MRIVIIVLVVIAVAFAFVAIQGGTSGPKSADGAPPTKSDGSVDEDKLDSWQKPDFPVLIAKLTAPFAPKLKLDNPHIALAKGAHDTRWAPISTSKMRVAKVDITSGEAMRITYSCLPKDGRQCGKPVCVCPAGAIPSDVSDCPDGWAQKHKNRMCIADDAETSLVIYPEAAPIQFTALGAAAVTAEVK